MTNADKYNNLHGGNIIEELEEMARDKKLPQKMLDVIEKDMLVFYKQEYKDGE